MRVSTRGSEVPDWAEVNCGTSGGRGVAQLGSAPEWGSGGRWFESSRPDQGPCSSVEHRRPGRALGKASRQPATATTGADLLRARPRSSSCLCQPACAALAGCSGATTWPAQLWARFEHRAAYSSGGVDGGAPRRLVVDSVGETHGQRSRRLLGRLGRASRHRPIAAHFSRCVDVAPWDPTDDRDRFASAGSPGLPPQADVSSATQPPLTGRCLFAAALRFHCREATVRRATGHPEQYGSAYGLSAPDTEVAAGPRYGGVRCRTYRGSRARLPIAISPFPCCERSMSHFDQGIRHTGGGRRCGRVRGDRISPRCRWATTRR